MKNIIAKTLIGVVGLSFTACDNFLDDNRYPETLIVDSPLYWNNADNCELQCARFYP